jgi:DnaD/phage-associated family protein
MSAQITESEIAEKCGIDEYDVKEALLYWADTGILLPKNSEPVKTEKTKSVKKTDKPTRSDVAKRGDDPKIRYLLRETQVKLGRNLKSNEASTLVWLYDDEGLDVSLILLIVQYAVAHNKANIRFIESTAVEWVKKGISDIESAEEELKRMAMSEQAWGIVSSAFGLEKRKPSQKESELSYMWLNEWEFSKEMLERAYEESVNAKSKFSLAYTAKILENWHKKGYKKPEDIEEKKPQTEENNFAAYDLDLFEKMLNSKD